MTVTIENPNQNQSTEDPKANPPIETELSIPETGDEDTETEGDDNTSGEGVETEETAPTE